MLVLDSSFVLKKHGAKQNKISRAKTSRLVLIFWWHISLQDGATVRFVSALVAPVFPLVVFLCCLLVEVAKPGWGIAGGLQEPGMFGWLQGV